MSRPIIFDNGELRLDPLSGTRQLDEAHAMALFRAGSPPTTVVTDVVVVYAAATLRLPISTAGLVLRPRAVPTFAHRPVWAILWQNNGRHSCPDLGTAPTRPAPEPTPVELIAADGTGDGAIYRTRGAECAAPAAGPDVSIASYYVSLAWTVVSRSASQIVARLAPVPGCGEVELTPSFVSEHEHRSTLGAYAFVLATAASCTTPGQPSTITWAIPANFTLTHEPVGLSLGRSTSIDTSHGLTYFDGQAHTEP